MLTLGQQLGKLEGGAGAEIHAGAASGDCSEGGGKAVGQILKFMSVVMILLIVERKTHLIAVSLLSSV